MTKICQMPFKMFITTPNGEVYPCCSEFTNYSFGNVYKDSLQEILHGKRIIEFRKSILSGEYKYCNRELCLGFISNQFAELSDKKIQKMIDNYPLEINLTVDTTCNAKCVMCRDKNWILEPELKKQLNNTIENVFIPMLKHSKFLVLNCDGEFFASKESQDMVKRTAKLYPKLQYEILTNGILCSRKKLEELGIVDKLRRITLSLHAASSETHERILRVKNKYKQVIKNIEDLVELRNNGVLKDFGVVFVLSSLNYKDLPNFAKLLEKYKICGDIWQFRDWQHSKMCEEYDKYDITNPNHPEYDEFLKVLQHPAMKSEYCIMNDKVKTLYTEVNKKKITKKSRPKKVCRMPFSRFDILPDGETYCCCAEFANLYSFGNIYEQSIDEILNGERLKKFRDSVLSGEYKYCNTKMCSHFVQDQFVSVKKALELQKVYPRDINLTLDTACNAKCVMCRDKNIPLPKDIKSKVKTAIDETFIPLLKNTKLLVINCDGEFFVSKESKELVSRCAKLYPKLKYEILTNGILCNKKNLEELGIIDKIQRVTLSLHASSPKTHEKIVRVKNKYYQVIENIEYLTQLRNDKKIKDFGLVFVLSSLNYKDLPGYIDLLEKYQISGDVWEYRDWGVSKMCHDYDKYDITNSNHPEHKKFLKMLSSECFNSKWCVFNDKLLELREKALNIFN